MGTQDLFAPIRLSDPNVLNVAKPGMLTLSLVDCARDLFSADKERKRTRSILDHVK